MQPDCSLCIISINEAVVNSFNQKSAIDLHIALGGFMKFGEKLRKERQEKGMTQAELAKAAGLSLRTISYYEQGKTYPQDRAVYGRLADILGINADYLHNENDDFIADAQALYGSRGRKDAEELLVDINGLFAGGEMADEDMDEFMKKVQEAFWKAKENNRKKYTRKDYRKDE